MAFRIKNIVEGAGKIFASKEVSGEHYPIVITQDEDGHSYLLDRTGALVTIDLAHHMVHQGFHFMFTDKFALNDAGVKAYHIVTPDQPYFAHMWFDLTGSAITQFDFYEGSDRGTITLASFGNNNRNSAHLPTTWIFSDPTGGTTDGILLHSYKGGAAAQQSRSVSGSGNNEEIILKRNTKYLLRVTSGTANNLCNVKLEWYETGRG